MHIPKCTESIARRTASLSSVVLHSIPLTVKGVVDGPGEVALGAVGAALAGDTQLLSSALGEPEDVALGEHGEIDAGVAFCLAI